IKDIEQKERLSEAQTDDRYNMGQFYENQRRFRDNVEAGGNWYFYNQATLTFGRTEFRNRWGQRKMEDDWRRKNKARANTMGITDSYDAEISGDTIAAIMDIKSPEYYLKDLPVNDTLIAISNDQIAFALFNSAKVFNEKFNDNTRANENYSDLLDRFPDHALIPQALYNIYNLNKDIDPAFSELIKGKLLSKYPDSEFARIISDPNYYLTLREALQREEKLYNSAYEAWKEDSFALALVLCEQGLESFPDGDLKPKFMLLRAFCLAQSVDERTLKKELQTIETEFPGSEEAKRASGLIAYINRETPELKIEEEAEIARNIYSTDLSGPHHFIIIIKNKDLDINRLTFDVINFNIDMYTNENYSSRGELQRDSFIMITVSTLADEYVAADYYNQFDYTKVLKNIADTEVLTFTISDTNLEVLREDMDPDRYYLFFQAYYLNQEN
ncbi:MAG: hypothetical protein QNK33_09320, partial [Bacteroidales bacterium]|nr:hypothetical protein [Bacteroidales bacterium]